MIELVVDNFAGGGGASLGIERGIGRAVDIAVNHDAIALATHAANHPHTRHLCEDVFDVDPVEATGGRAVGLAWFSPDCKHFSRAKGAKPVSKRIRGLAWVAVRWAEAPHPVAPRVIVLENVREFQDWGPLTRDGMPCRRRRGKTFLRFVTRLRELGYAVEWRVLDAADYGAPTHRKRLFIIARRDGEPVVWPAPTHGKGRRPYRTAAECIDWSIPCPSIFERTRPLAEKTCRRIAAGLVRYVLENPRPFIVHLTHGGERRVHPVEEPLPTVTGANRGEMGVCAPFMVPRHGEAPGQSPRARSIEDPMPTVTGTANGATLVSAFVAKHYGGVVGHGPERAMGTITAKDHHSVCAAWLTKLRGMAGWKPAVVPMDVVCAGAPTFGATVAHLTKFYGTNNGAGGDLRDPMPTATAGAGGGHAGLVAAFLTKYYGTNIGQGIGEPLQTVTSKHRFGLVTVTIDGEEWAVVDIGLRMLTPRELARAQGFPDSYELLGTKTKQVALVGNSVCPPVAEAIVRANVSLADADVLEAVA